jgi:dTDP-4-dehydrorhamnose reductase
VGRDLCRAAWPAGTVLAPFERSAADIARRDAVTAVLDTRRPDLVVNLAAYTAVDRAEGDAEAAWRVNANGAGVVAEACAQSGIPLIHLSTDYVFDGEKMGPYREDDRINPIGVYGASKEAGERAVREALSCHVILRTAWVYGAFGQNFVKTILRLGAERDRLRVVADQRGCPTAAGEIAAAVVALAERIAPGTQAWGTYHFAGAGETTWHGFAEAVLGLAEPYTGRRPQVEAITTADYPTPARRPRNSVLDCGKIARAFGIAPAPWRAPLTAVIGELLGQGTR